MEIILSTIKITQVQVAIERAVTVAPYTMHKVRIAVQADIPSDLSYGDALEALREAVSSDVDRLIEIETLEYGGND